MITCNNIANFQSVNGQRRGGGQIHFAGLTKYSGTKHA